MSNWNPSRRKLLEFFGVSTAAVGLSSLTPLLSSCSAVAKTAGEQTPLASSTPSPHLPFKPIRPSLADAVILAEGFTQKVLIRWDDPLNATENFGINNDYMAFFPLDSGGQDGILWVNHEAPHSLFVAGHTNKHPRTRIAVTKEQLSIGGSLIRVRQGASGEWSFVKNDTYNRRLTARTPIPIVTARPIEGKRVAIGTVGNCAGGVTPWGTLLTAEENYANFYGEVAFDKDHKRTKVEEGKFRWDQFDDFPPEHYGWIVEVNPKTGAAKKLTSFGRYAHECATCVLAKDGRTVAYSGDDANDQYLYKLVGDKPGSLETGTLYVANIEMGRWLPLDVRRDPRLKAAFKDQTELLIRAREAGRIVGATPLARPEDVEICPRTGAIYVCLTNNYDKNDWMGRILKITEKDGDYRAEEFTSSDFLTGGETTGFANPDNMAFDKMGNLWMTSDIPGKMVGKAPFEKFKNNGLFFIPMSGAEAGRVFQVASSPVDAEFTGPCFSPDGRTLFLSVQHPGEESKSLEELSSHWPDGGTSLPRSAVIVIQGPALDKIMGV